MYTLYGFPFSQHSRRVVSLLEETGLEYEFKNVDMMNGEHMSPTYLEINPNHQVPTLIADNVKFLSGSIEDLSGLIKDLNWVSSKSYNSVQEIQQELGKLISSKNTRELHSEMSSAINDTMECSENIEQILNQNDFNILNSTLGIGTADLLKLTAIRNKLKRKRLRY